MNTADQINTKNNAQSLLSRKTYIQFRCSLEEKTIIEARAKEVKLSISAYARLLCLGYKPPAPVSVETLEAFLAFRADNSRLGNLFHRLQKSNLDFLKKAIGQRTIEKLTFLIEENSQSVSLYLKKLHQQHSKPRKEEF